jgi:hypothetical protein
MILPYIKNIEVSLKVKEKQITEESSQEDIYKLNLTKKELETKAGENKASDKNRNAWEKLAKSK